MKLPLSFRFTSSQWLYIAGVLIIVVFAILRNYFSLDEADLIWETTNGPGPYGGFRRFLSEGRPIYGSMVMAGFKIMATIENLKYLRIMTVIGTFLSCILLFSFLKRNRVNEVVAFLISILVFALPGFSVFICWAECFPDHISFILSFLAGMLVLKVFIKFMGDESFSKGKENMYIVIAIIMQVISLFIYQTLALSFLLPAFITLFLKKDVSGKKRLVFFLCVFFIFCLSLGIYYKIYQGLLFSSNISITNRAKFVVDMAHKLRWFITQLHLAAELHFLLFKTTWLQYVAIVPFVFVLIRDLVKKRFLDLAFLLIFSALLFLPLLLLDESWGASRNFTLISLVVIFYILIRLFEFIPVPSFTVAGIVGLIFVGIMFINIYDGWSMPQHKDYNQMKTFVEQLPTIQNDTIIIEALLPSPDIHEKNSMIVHYCDEFNDPLFIHIWPVQPGIRVLYKEKHPDISYDKINSLIRLKVIKDSILYSKEVPGKLLHLNLNYRM